MARTRSAIRTLVEGHTGKTSKTSLIDALLDSGLKEAQMRYSFRDGLVVENVNVSDGDTEVALSGLTYEPLEILSILVKNTDETTSKRLILKDTFWWNKFVGNPSDTLEGWPEFGNRVSGNIVFDRTLNEDYILQFTYSQVLSFAADGTECPIEVLDIFLEHYATAMVFLELEAKEDYVFWMKLAIGNKFNWEGGSFSTATIADDRETAEEFQKDLRIKTPGITTELVGSNWPGDLSEGDVLPWY